MTLGEDQFPVSVATVQLLAERKEPLSCGVRCHTNRYGASHENIGDSVMNRNVLAIAGAGTVALMIGCGGSISPLTKERVARSENTVQQATQTLGNNEAGALDLQRAKENLSQAKQAIGAENDKRANRFAQQAQLDAELALAKADTVSSRKAADEVLASIEVLRKEAARGTP